MSINKLDDEKIKYTVFTYYSNVNHPECCNCGYENIKALCLDHVNGDGYKHRKEGSNKGINLYRKLIRMNFKSDYKLQVLCFNCNAIKVIENKENSHVKSEKWKRKQSITRSKIKQPTGKEAYRSRPVEQYDLNMNYIQTWSYIKEAELYYNDNPNAKNIVAVCNNRQKTAYQYIWKHKEIL